MTFDPNKSLKAFPPLGLFQFLQLESFSSRPYILNGNKILYFTFWGCMEVRLEGHLFMHSIQCPTYVHTYTPTLNVCMYVHID